MQPGQTFYFNNFLPQFREWVHLVNLHFLNLHFANLHFINLTFGQLQHLVNCYQRSTDTFHPTTFGQLIQTHINFVNIYLDIVNGTICKKKKLNLTNNPRQSSLVSSSIVLERYL